MMEIKAALDAAFAAYAEALSKGAPEEVALDVGLARYRAYFPNAVTSVFEIAINAAREKSKMGPTGARGTTPPVAVGSTES
jgi:hypothetical protein